MLKLQMFRKVNGGLRPIPDRRGDYLISIVKTTYHPVDYQVFAERIVIISLTSISARNLRRIPEKTNRLQAIPAIIA
jgi:hypothetical protein